MEAAYRTPLITMSIAKACLILGCYEDFLEWLIKNGLLGYEETKLRKDPNDYTTVRVSLEEACYVVHVFTRRKALGQSIQEIGDHLIMDHPGDAESLVHAEEVVLRYDREKRCGNN